MRVTDVVPLSSDDPIGAGLSSASFPLVLGGMLGGVLVSLLVAGAVRRVIALLVYGAAAGAVVTFVLQTWLHVLQGDWLANAAAFGLAMLATAAVVVGFNSLIGTPGIAVGAVISLLIGNPISGAAVPAQFIAGPWGDIGQWFVPGAASSLVRSLSYFPDADTAPQWWTLAAWAAGGIVLTLVGTSAAAPRSRCRRPSSTRSRPRPDGSHAAAREDGGTRARRHPLVPTRRSAMTLPLRFGYKASAEQFGPAELLEFGVLAEQAGFDSLFVSDHFQPWNHEGGHAPAAIPWLGALGARTSTMVLGTSVLTPTFRYHPGVVAQAFATLGSMFPDRIVLGVGTGEALNEVALGITWPDQKERFARLQGGHRPHRAALDRGRRDPRRPLLPHRARHHLRPPEQPVPIYIGASGPAATRLAGRRAAGWITTSGKAPELYTDTLLPALQEGITAADRSADDVDTLMEMKVSFDHDRDRALQDTRYWAPLALAARGEDDRPRPAGDAAARGCAAHRAGRVALDRLDGSGRARGAHRGGPGPRVPAPRVPRSGRRPAPVHRALRHRDPAPAPRQAPRLTAAAAIRRAAPVADRIAAGLEPPRQVEDLEPRRPTCVGRASRGRPR